MKAFSIIFDPEIDDVKIKFSEEFVVENYIIQLDVVKDSIFALQQIYEGMLEGLERKAND